VEIAAVANFCEHCEGQRFDRAQVLRALRQLQRTMRTSRRDAALDAALDRAIKTVAGLEIPHLDIEYVSGDVVH
jgi:hypothetical protein